MPWVEFADQAAFDVAHDARCAELGIPRPGENGATSKTDLVAQWTTAQWKPVASKAKGTVLVEIDVDEAKGAKVVKAPKLPTMDDMTSEVEAVVFVVEKPLPDTWIVDGKAEAVPKKAQK